MTNAMVFYAIREHKVSFRKILECFFLQNCWNLSEVDGYPRSCNLEPRTCRNDSPRHLHAHTLKQQ